MSAPSTAPVTSISPASRGGKSHERSSGGGGHELNSKPTPSAAAAPSATYAAVCARGDQCAGKQPDSAIDITTSGSMGRTPA